MRAHLEKHGARKRADALTLLAVGLLLFAWWSLGFGIVILPDPRPAGLLAALTLGAFVLVLLLTTIPLGGARWPSTRFPMMLRRSQIALGLPCLVLPILAFVLDMRTPTVVAITTLQITLLFVGLARLVRSVAMNQAPRGVRATNMTAGMLFVAISGLIPVDPSSAEELFTLAMLPGFGLVFLGLAMMTVGIRMFNLMGWLRLVALTGGIAALIAAFIAALFSTKVAHFETSLTILLAVPLFANGLEVLMSGVHEERPGRETPVAPARDVT